MIDRAQKFNTEFMFKMNPWISLKDLGVIIVT